MPAPWIWPLADVPELCRVEPPLPWGLTPEPEAELPWGLAPEEEGEEEEDGRGGRELS